jgi:osmotically-inducible protein OsmY
MAKLRPLGWGVAAGIVLAAGQGCDSQDSDRIARVARCVSDRIEAVAPKTAGNWENLPLLKSSPEHVSLQSRVASRLRWEKSLEGSQIQVQASDKTVELKGTVANLQQRRRAVALAESTVGVEKVEDHLEVPAS